jgi:hypothetical protein
MWQYSVRSALGVSTTITYTGFTAGDIVTFGGSNYLGSDAGTLVTIQGDGAPVVFDYTGSAIDAPAEPYSGLQVVAPANGEISLTFSKGTGGSNAYAAITHSQFTVQAGGPALTEPSLIDSDGIKSGTGTDLSTTAPFRFQASLDDFATIPFDVDVTSWVSNRTATTFDIDVKQGYEESLTDVNNAFDAMPLTNTGWKTRWITRNAADDDDLTLEFTNQVVSTHESVPFAKSQYIADNSLLTGVQQYAGENDALVLPKTVTVTEGTLTLDLGDVDHPMPNYIGGDLESVTGSVLISVFNEEQRKAYAHRLEITTPITPSSAPTTDATDITVDTTAYTADQT